MSKKLKDDSQKQLREISHKMKQINRRSSILSSHSVLSAGLAKEELELLGQEQVEGIK